MEDAQLIMDLGMCEGSDTAFYLAKGFRVLALEANPFLIEYARKRFARQIEDGRLTIVGKAIAADYGRRNFFIHRRVETWSTLCAERFSNDSSQFDEIEVECIPFDAVLREHGIPYYLKIDLEGSDSVALAALTKFGERPSYVSVEAHDRSLVDLLCDLGYRRFQLRNQARHNWLVWRQVFRQQREGKHIIRRFTGLHSGYFGRDLPGPWLDRERVLGQYDKLVSRGRLTWHDFHAAR